MALVRWEPVRELDTLQGDMNRLFDSFFGGPANGTRARRWVPAMDLVETEDAPGPSRRPAGPERDDVAIEIKDNVLTVSGERKAEHTEKRTAIYRVERAFGSFTRSLASRRASTPKR